MIITRPTETIYYGLGHRPGRTRVTIWGVVIVDPAFLAL